jgi:hypothetical protein
MLVRARIGTAAKSDMSLRTASIRAAGVPSRGCSRCTRKDGTNRQTARRIGALIPVIACTPRRRCLIVPQTGGKLY